MSAINMLIDNFNISRVDKLVSRWFVMRHSWHLTSPRALQFNTACKIKLTLIPREHSCLSSPVQMCMTFWKNKPPKNKNVHHSCPLPNLSPGDYIKYRIPGAWACWEGSRILLHKSIQLKCKCFKTKRRKEEKPHRVFKSRIFSVAGVFGLVWPCYHYTQPHTHPCKMKILLSILSLSVL